MREKTLESHICPDCIYSPYMDRVILLPFETLESTHLYAKRERGSFDPALITCLSAEEQTKGIGQKGRSWHSPRGVNLYLTFYFRLRSPEIATLGLLMAASLSSVLLRHRLQPWLKWPNDLLLRGKKVSGILCEISDDEIFLSIGINVNMESCSKIDQPATSLFLETKKQWDRAALYKELEKQLLHDLDLFKAEGFAPIALRLEPLIAYQGETVRTEEGLIGTLHSLALDGRLNLRMPDGTLRQIASGRIFPCKS